MSPWLTPEEMEELTGAKRRSTQCARLAAMGVPYRPNGAGRPLVERAAVLHHCEHPERLRGAPNWDALDDRSSLSKHDNARRKMARLTSRAGR